MMPPSPAVICAQLLPRIYAAETRVDGQLSSARELSRQIACASGIEAGLAFEVLTFLPENMLSLLHSPEGWSALAEYVAADLGTASSSYSPTRH